VLAAISWISLISLKGFVAFLPKPTVFFFHWVGLKLSRSIHIPQIDFYSESRTPPYRVNSMAFIRFDAPAEGTWSGWRLIGWGKCDLRGSFFYTGRNVFHPRLRLWLPWLSWVFGLNYLVL
jgi:hypothetical protein